MRLAFENDLFALVEWLVVRRDLDVGRVLHTEVDLGGLGLPVSRILRLAGQVGVVVLLLRGELEGRDGRDPLGILDFLRGLRDSFRDHRARSVQPGYLER